jgi:hypothetical protein
MWPTVILTPEETKIKVFKRGISIGLTASTP